MEIVQEFEEQLIEADASDDIRSNGYSFLMSPLNTLFSCQLLILGTKPGGSDHHANPMYSTSESVYTTTNKRGTRSQFQDSSGFFEVSTKLCGEMQKLYHHVAQETGLPQSDVSNTLSCHSNLFHLRQKDCKQLTGNALTQSKRLSNWIWSRVLPLMDSLRGILVFGSDKAWVEHTKTILLSVGYNILSCEQRSAHHGNYSWYKLETEFQGKTIPVTIIPHLSRYYLCSSTTLENKLEKDMILARICDTFS